MECLYSLFCRLPDVVERVPMATIHEESKHTSSPQPPSDEIEARACTSLLHRCALKVPGAGLCSFTHKIFFAVPVWGWSRYWVPALQDVSEICKDPRLEVYRLGWLLVSTRWLYLLCANERLGNHRCVTTPS
jgi:hypothetical protein